MIDRYALAREMLEAWKHDDFVDILDRIADIAMCHIKAARVEGYRVGVAVAARQAACTRPDLATHIRTFEDLEPPGWR
jgi:hypothetical protein